MLASITTQIPVTRMRESVRAIINLAHFWSNTRLFPPLRSRYTPLHDVTGAGETVLNASVPTSVRGSQSGGISTRGVWCHVPYVYCAENSADGIPVLWKLDTMKANVRCFTIVSAITECWHSKFRHVRYVLFGESLQKHSKIHCQSQSRGLGSQQWSHERYNSTVPRSMTWPQWRTYMCPAI